MNAYAYNGNTQQLFMGGAIAHLHLLDEDAPRLVRVAYTDTLGVAAVLTPYETWAEYKSQEDPEELGLPQHVRLFPWHNVQELDLVANGRVYAEWVADRAAAKAVAA